MALQDSLMAINYERIKAEKEQTEIIEKMKQGIEPGFGTLNKAYRNQDENNQ